MSFLEGLNSPQREAVTHLGSPLLVLAGAGSGKTRVITYRIAWLIQETGLRPEQFLAVTFTNKAAGEMKERVQQMLEGRVPPNRLWVSTFHSTCVRILRRDGPAAGIPKDFTIYDEDAQLALVKMVVKELGLDDHVYTPRNVLSRISHAKNHGVTPQESFQDARDPKAERMAVIFEHYQKGLQRNRALDFDDLLLETVRLLRVSPETAAKYNQRFQHLLVDEYQDTNRVQYEFIRRLTPPEKNICVVGDEDQSIYGWRGADIRNILEFEKDFPEAKVVRLEQNYRSTKSILAGAAAVVAHNEARLGKTLWTDREQGPRIAFYEAADAEQEALFIADTIFKNAPENSNKRVAVLYRTNGQSRLVEEALRRYGLKYHVVGGFSFYERAEIRDLVAYLKAASNPDDSISLLRILNTPPRGIGKTTAEQLEQTALEHNTSMWGALGLALEQQTLPRRALAALAGFRHLIEDAAALAVGQAPINELLKFVLEKTRYAQLLEEDGSPEALGRLENIQELMNAAADAVARQEALAEFLDHAALMSDADDIDERAPISLHTLHTAKGLEFSLVFLAGMEEGVFPHGRSLSTTLGVEEERRLCYVGMTRAQDRLFLTRALVRRHFGSEMPDDTEPSRFLSEIPKELIEDLSPRHKMRASEMYKGPVYNSADNIRDFFAKRGVAMPVQPKASQVIREEAPERGLKIGGRVRHAKYGIGTVLRREGEGGDAKLTISFPGYGLKKLVERYAGLEKA